MKTKQHKPLKKSQYKRNKNDNNEENKEENSVNKNVDRGAEHKWGFCKIISNEKKAEKMWKMF